MDESDCGKLAYMKVGELSESIDSLKSPTAGAELVASTPAQPNPNPTLELVKRNQYFFDQSVEKLHTPAPQAEVDKVANLVEDVLQAGIEHKVRTDSGVRNKVLETADDVIDTHLKVAKSRADKADKKAFFEANEAACTYFGYDEKTTGKSHVIFMRAWSWVFNMLYIVTLGFFVVAPISFFIHKLRVIIKKSWIVLLLALVIYALIVMTPFFIVWLRRV